MNKFWYIVYSWLTTAIFAGLIYWLATIPNFDVSTDVGNEVAKVFFRMVMYGFLFLLAYRSLIATFRGTVQRLAEWRSKREAIEDAEFVLIIETLLVIIGILGSTLFAVFEEYTQASVAGRAGEVKDVLVSVMAVLLTALIVYSMPVVGELEMAVAHYYQRRKKQLSGKPKSTKKKSSSSKKSASKKSKSKSKSKSSKK